MFLVLIVFATASYEFRITYANIMRDFAKKIKLFLSGKRRKILLK